MRLVSICAIAGALVSVATQATAADMSYPPPQAPICVSKAQAHMWPGVPLCAEETFNGWYLRGDIGITNQQLGKLENSILPASAREVSLDFDSAGLFGLGVGYQFNNWFRVDVTGEYRSASDFTGLHVINGTDTDEYRAKKTEWLFLANAYVDLGTWWCMTPFVGAGIGASRVSISGFTDINTPNAGVAFGADRSKWNLAWALHAGVGYQATKNLTLELAYRYTHLGDGITGDVVTYNGVNDFNNPTTFKNINSHDLKLGLRWTCCDDPPPPPPPLVRKG